MEPGLAVIGFGEAASAFAANWPADAPTLRAYDRKTAHVPTAAAKWADYARAGVCGCQSAAAALSGAAAALSLVTADQALAAAREAAGHLAPGTLWLDMNSVAPDTKRACAEAIEAARGRYVDVAVMSPVHPAGRAAPLLLSGPHAEAGAAMLRAAGFSKLRVITGSVGRAAAIKMIRSVVVKGIEALTAECVLAAARADVLEEVLGSLDASPPPPDWGTRADYNLDRMMVHGLRRAAEMEEVVKTLDALCTGSVMARGTAERQRSLGALGLAPPAGLDAKLAALSPTRRARVA